MKKAIIQLAKHLLPERIYHQIRLKKQFNDLQSPFPLHQVEKTSIDWSLFQKQTRSDRAVYIVSPTQRSGTNYLSHILSHHPSLVVPKSPLFPDEQCLYSYTDDLKKYVSNTIGTWSKWTKKGDGTMSDQAKRLMGFIGNGILSYFSEDLKSNQRLLLKTPDTGNIEDYFHLFPQTKVLILIRDGRDTVESFAKSWGGLATFKRMTRRWKDRIIQLESFQQRLNASGMKDKYLIVKYESLNENQEGEVMKALNFIGLEPDKYPWEALKKLPVLGSSDFRGESKEVNWKPLQKNDQFNPTGKWIEWSKGKKRTFKKIAGSELIRLGYEKDLNW